ncbi:MAG TPA: tandem-95 repeat protein [Verrucomicrobiae bacterium]|nr:tandem-95 repeat protein [Verrucomicrobiae bacterium]
MSHFGALRAVAIASVLGAATGPAGAYSGGIAGYSGNPSAAHGSSANCTSCHYGATGNYTAYTALINGSSAGTTVIQGVNTDQLITVTTSHSGNNAVAAGLNASTNSGTLTSGSSTRVTTAGVDGIDGEITQTGAFALSAGNSWNPSWNFTFNPSGSTAAVTLYVCVNPVDGDGVSYDDGDGPADCRTHTLDVNSQPVIGNVANQSILEDGNTGALSFSVSDTETAAASLTVTRSSSNTTLVPTANVVLGGSGGSRTVTVTPAANQSGTATITVTVSDGDGGTDIDTFVVTVTAVNDEPTLTAIGNPAAISEDAGLQTVNLSGIGAGGGESQTLTVTAISSDTAVIPNPSVTYTSANATGSISYTPVANANGSVTITVTVADNGGTANGGDNQVSQTFTATVNAVNDAPNAVDDSQGIAKNSTGNTLPVRANDTDIDSANLDITAVGATSNGGSVSIQGSFPNESLLYAPATNYSGIETFSYTISDGALSDTATVTITVSTGTAPVGVADAATFNEDSSSNVIDVLSNDTDADVGDTKTVTQVNGNGSFPVATAQGSVTRSGSGAGNTLLYTPAANYAGADSFTYTVQDAGGLTSTATVSVTVDPINDTPTITAPASLGVTEDVATAITGISFTDVDAASGSVIATFTVGSGTLAASSGGGVTVGGSATARTLTGTLANINSFLAGSNLAFTTASNSNASVSLGVAFSDNGNTGSGGTQSASPASLTLTVTAVNDAPQISSSAVTTANDGLAYAYSVSVLDPDDTGWTFGLLNEPAGMTVDSAGNVSWLPPCSTTLAGYTTGSITVTAADGGENGAAAASQSWQVTVAAPDGDGDGMPNCYELANGFDPANAADGAQDRDGDGKSNAQEFADGTNPDLDDVAPVVTAPADLVLPATGYLTAIDVGEATVADALDGTLQATLDDAGPYRPGRYTLTWTATDAAGNVGTDSQHLEVLPLANFAVDQVSGEGASVVVRITLNGEAPQYPVTIPYTVGGTAGAGDSNAGTSGSVVITTAGATAASIPVTINADGSGETSETLVFTMGTPTQAVVGTRGTHTLTITDLNAPPSVTLAVSQGTPRLTVFRDQGTVTVTSTLADPNPGDLLSVSFTGTDAAIAPASALGSFTFNPASLALGSYTVVATASDAAGATGTARLLIHVEDAMPALGSGDTDGDGTIDSTEGFADLDLDGVPDWRDAFAEPALLQNQTGAAAAAELLETEPGLTLRMGRTALAAGRTGALIEMSDLVIYGTGGGGIATGADSYDNLGGLFDFEVHGLARGGIARVVVPLQTSLRSGATWRKFGNGGWRDFVSNAGNAVASAYSTQDQCPGPASTAYASGLLPFADCVRLTLQDGGPNDADGMADGVVRDPGGAAVDDAVPPVAATPVANGGAFNPLVALWLLLAAMLRGPRASVRRLIVVLLFAGFTTPAAAQYGSQVPQQQLSRTSFSGDVGSGFDTNVGNAQADADVRESGFVSAAGHASWQHRLNLYTTVLLRGTLQGEHVESFEGLSNAKGIGMARLVYRPDGDFFTPQIAGWVSAAYWEFDSAIRDGVEYRGGAYLAQQVTTQISARLSVGASQRESESRVFDVAGFSGGINVDWLPMAGLTIYGGYQHYRGDVVSTATPGTLNIGRAAEVIEADDAFGGFATGMRAYRLDAASNIGTLGFNYALSRNLSVDAQAQQIDTQADFDNEYQRTVGVVSLLVRF